DALAEEPVTLRLERPVVDGLRLRHLAVAPAPDLLRGSDLQLDEVEVARPRLAGARKIDHLKCSPAYAEWSPLHCRAAGPGPRAPGRGRGSCSRPFVSVVEQPGSTRGPGPWAHGPGPAPRHATAYSSRPNVTDSPRACSSFTSTLNDSGIPGSGRFSPLTIASYTRLRPFTSSDLTVSISCSTCAAPYASSAHTSISPKRWPPNCALPASGCWVTSEYGPIDRAWILSSTRWLSFSM